MSAATEITADQLPEGEFAIVEAMGHRTLVGRIAEIERFGTKLLQIEPFFGGLMLGPIMLGGSSIYQLTPCSAATAWARRPQSAYQLPASVLATVPAAALPKPEPDMFGEECSCEGGEDQPGGVAYRANDCPIHGEIP